MYLYMNYDITTIINVGKFIFHLHEDEILIENEA